MPKTALVTGAARGIGRATAEALRNAGCNVIGLDREACDVVYDLTDIAGIPRMAESLGEIDILVNNAGVQTAVAIDRYTEEARRRILAVNLEAPVELIRALSKQMVARKSGRIINLASIAAYGAHTDLWYGVTKAGVVSFTRSFARSFFTGDPRWLPRERNSSTRGRAASSHTFFTILPTDRHARSRTHEFRYSGKESRNAFLGCWRRAP